MSYFQDGIIYIIVPTVEATTEMENNMKRDFNASFSTVKRSTDLVEKVLFKVKEPVDDSFCGYTWYNHDDILVELQKDEWN